MSAKNRDNKNRWRNIPVGFRVSPEENERINKAVALSGLPKQEYCYRRCLNQDVVVPVSYTHLPDPLHPRKMAASEINRYGCGEIC